MSRVIPPQIDEPFEPQGMLRPRRIVALVVASFLLLCGIGNSSALAKCGSASEGSAWKYRNTSELTTWDGRWWSIEQPSSVWRESAHAPEESDPCSHCGGRPPEDGPPPTPFIPVKTSDTVVFSQCGSRLIDRDAPPPDTIVFVNVLVQSPEMEVAERPPKASS